MSNEQVDPSTRPANAIDAANAAHGSISRGIATEFWLELVNYPTGYVAGLWLLVNETWRFLEKPSTNIQDSVQSAFCNCPKILEVVVWYKDDLIVGLVVRSKYRP